MSEFQHYYFRAIDRPLSAEEYKKVDALSSHIDVSSSSAEVSYSYGDFKHDEEKVTAQYFDAMLYQTNWGQKKLMFRFPKDSVDYNEMAEYCIDGSDFTGYTTEIKVWETTNYTLLVIEYCEEDSGEYVEEKALGELLDLRKQLIEGDYSCLYAFWLKILSLKEENDEDEYDDEDDETTYELPTLPLGLAKPSSALKAFINFYDIDDKLTKAAATFIQKTEKQEPDYQVLIKNMPESDKTQWLFRLIQGETLLDVKLKKNLTGASPNDDSINVTFEQIIKKALKIK